MSDLIATIIEGGVEGALCVFLLTISYKLYRARIESTTKSDCCTKACKFKLNTSNSGGDVPNPENSAV